MGGGGEGSKLNFFGSYPWATASIPTKIKNKHPLRLEPYGNQDPCAPRHFRKEVVKVTPDVGSFFSHNYLCLMGSSWQY
jgi:hypothetical protein